MKVLFLLLIGLAAVNADQKIVGGDPAGGPIKYQAMILDSFGFLRCGGILVKSDWIVSAAHCAASGSQIDTWKIVLGAYSLTDAKEKTRQEFGIAKQIVHPDYNPDTLVGDVMVIQLNKEAKLDENVGLAYLTPQSKDPPVGTYVTVSGWGTLKSGGVIASVLMKVVVQVYDQSTCNEHYQGRIKTDMICLAADGKDSCQGDSGGPAVIAHADGSYELIGIVSWGVGCAHSLYPGVYARVAHYADWIHSSMN